LAISNRHIRHDWQTFVDWEQSSVKTVCGVKTRRHLAGVPGITEQPLVVSVGDKQAVGWCVQCAYRVNRDAQEIIKSGILPSISLKNLYVVVVAMTTRSAEVYKDRVRRV